MMGRLPNLLASRRGRLSAFFLLYVTEGLPLGFTAVAMASQLRRLGVGPVDIGSFVAALYLPWAFKWAYGPLIDVLRFRHLGPKRGWILITQLGMTATLALTAGFDLGSQLGFITALLFVHNTIGAMQDVAIDALAVNQLQADERGKAAGLMFAGANVGQALGGAGAMAVAAHWGFGASLGMVCLALLSVTVLVVLPMREPVQAAADEVRASLAEFGRRVWAFVRTTADTLRQERAARWGLLASLLPPGALSLNLALQTNLGVDLGLNEERMAGVSLISTVLGAAGCLLGGWLSDRIGRRLTLAGVVLGLVLPVGGLSLLLWTQGWGGVPPTALDPTAVRALAPDLVVGGFVGATAGFALLNGMMYGSSISMYMDITRPAVAATQFTAYMALANLAISYSAQWQGWAIQHWGYSATLVLDGLLGCVVLAVLPMLKPRAPDAVG